MKDIKIEIPVSELQIVTYGVGLRIEDLSNSEGTLYQKRMEAYLLRLIRNKLFSSEHKANKSDSTEAVVKLHPVEIDVLFSAVQTIEGIGSTVGSLLKYSTYDAHTNPNTYRKLPSTGL